MDRVFSRGRDPYAYAKNPYEVARLDAMAKALGAGKLKHVLEVGAAEGLFTMKLAPLCARVTALELSPVAAARAREAVSPFNNVEVVEADVREWTPGSGVYDAVVLGDVLYYLDKPLVRDEFEAVFPRIASWVAPGGRLVLAHGFAGAEERLKRAGYAERFVRQGFRLESETVVGKAEKDGDVCCLLAVLRR